MLIVFIECLSWVGWGELEQENGDFSTVQLGQVWVLSGMRERHPVQSWRTEKVQSKLTPEE